MISGEDDSSALNGRLRPRKSTATTPNSPSKFSSKSEKVAPDKLKRNSSPSQASPNKHDDLTSKADPSSIAQFLCPLCDKKFTSKVSFKRHTRRLHQLFINCIFCNYSDAPSDEDVMRHMVNNHPNQYFACLICNTRFNSTKELAEHKLATCKKPELAYISKLRQKNTSVSKKNPEKIKGKEKIPVENKEPTLKPEFNALVISCELKPSLVHDAVDIEEKITTNVILPSNINKTGTEQNTVLILDDIQWNKRMPPNFSFRNADADQILSRLGVVHRSPGVGEPTRKEWLKLIDDSSQKFEKCFDTSFYSRVASNVQENLAKFLDGSFNFSPDPDKIIKTRKSKSSAIINTAEGFPILLPYEQYSRNRFDGYIPRAIAPKHKWKWDSSDNERNMILDTNVIKRDNHVDNCIITLVSSLDIWTQLRMRYKFESIFCKSSTEKSEKQNIVSNQLKEILESREIPSVSRAVEQPSSSTAAVVAVTDTLDFPSVLGLAARGSGGTEMGLAPAVLSGEWVRPRCYVCCACGEQSREARELSAHVTAHHPNAQVQHYEIVGESLLNADILKHLYVPPSQMFNRTRPLRGFRDCTKCKKSITMEDMHQHMLDCAGDTPTVRRKCRSRLFGVRRRRPRLADNPITRKKLRKDLRSRQNQKTLLRARPRIRTEVGDAETIRKMIADLPAKRHRPANEPSATQQIRRPRRKLDKQRNKLKIKRLSSLERPSRKVASKSEINEPPIIDEDDQPLKPKTKIEPEKLVQTKKRFSTRVVPSRNKKDSTTAKELSTSNEKRQDAPSGSASHQNRVSRENTTQRLNINARENGTGEGDNRNSSDKNNGERRDQSPGENRDRHKDTIPDPPQLKHSINNITALTTTTESQQKKLPVQSTTEGSPIDARQVFLENEVGLSILDKPPLQKNLKKTPERKRLSLLNCIEKIKNQQKGDNMFQRPEMARKNQSGNEHPSLSLLDPHPAVICCTRDESGAANNVIPGNIDYQRYPPPTCLGMAIQPVANENIILNQLGPFYSKIGSDLEFTSPNAKPGRRRRKSSAVRSSPGRIEYEQATQLHYSHLLQQQQWNAMHNLPLIQSAVLAPQRLPYSDNMLMQLHASEAIKSGYPMQYKNMGFPLSLPYTTADLHYDGRRDHAQRVETGSYPSAPSISPHAWARESAHMQTLNNEHAIPVSLPPNSSHDRLMSIPRRTAKRSSGSSDTDYGSAQSFNESADPRNASESTGNLFMPSKSKIGRGVNYNNRRQMIQNKIVYSKTTDFTNYSVDNFGNHYENTNANSEAVVKEGEVYRTAQSQTTAASESYYISPATAEEDLTISSTAIRWDMTNQESNKDSVPKSLYSNNSNKKVFHERYLADHPHLSPSVPTESQAAKITTSANESTNLESYKIYTSVQNGDDNIKSVPLTSITRLDLHNHTPYIEVGDELDKSETLLDEPDSSLCEQPLDLSGKSATVQGTKPNDHEDIDGVDSLNTKNNEDVPTDLSLKDNRLFVKRISHDFQYAQKPRTIEQDNATPMQATVNSQLLRNVSETKHIDKSDSMSYIKKITTQNNHDESACVPSVDNIDTVDTLTVSKQLNLHNIEAISSHTPSNLLEEELFLARQRVRILEVFKSKCDNIKPILESNENSENKQNTSPEMSQNVESMKKKYTLNLPTIVLPDSALEFNNENVTSVNENRKEILACLNPETVYKIGLFDPENLNKMKEQNSQLEEMLCSILPHVRQATAISVFPENVIPQKVNELSVKEFTPTLCNASSNSFDSKLTVNTASLSFSSILPKKRHSPAARKNSLEAQTKIILNQALTQSSKSENFESELSKKIMTEEITKNSSEIPFHVQNKDALSEQIIDLTEDDLNNTTTNKTLEPSNELPILNITPKPQIKQFNEKTASLRAVRIKTFPSARKSQSDDLQQVSKESDNRITPLLDIGQKDPCILPTLDSVDKSTKIEKHIAPQPKDVREKYVTNDFEVRRSLDEVKKFIETKVQSITSKDTCDIVTIEKINNISDFVTAQVPLVEDVITTEPNETTEKCKETEYENNSQQNIDNYNAFIKTNKPKCGDAHNNDIGEFVDNSNSSHQHQDTLSSESSSLSLKEKNLTVLSIESIAQQPEILKDNIDSCHIDNQLEPESAKTYFNNEESEDDNVFLAAFASRKHNVKTLNEQTNKNPKQKKTSKKRILNKKKFKRKPVKLRPFKSRYLTSAKLHKRQTESQNANSRNDKSAQGSVEIKTVQVAKKIEESERNEESASNYTEKKYSDKKEDSNDTSKDVLAEIVDQPHSTHSHIEESNDVCRIENSALIINYATLVTGDNSNVEELDPISTQTVPVTKKQLIFTKLLHEENKHEETKQNLVLTTTDDVDEVNRVSQISIKRKKSSKKSKIKKRKSIEKDEFLKIDTKCENTSPKRKRKSSALVLNEDDQDISIAKQSKLANQNDATFLPHQDSTSCVLANPANKVTSSAHTEMTESIIDKSKEIQNQPEKANTSAEIRTACYNRPIHRLTSFASTYVKNPENYDPYDIDLEIDMAEIKRPVFKRKSNRAVSSSNSTKATKKDLIQGDLVEKHQDIPKAPLVVSAPLNDSDSSISDTPLQKYVEEKEKSKIEALKSVLVNTTDVDTMDLAERPSAEEPNLNNNNNENIHEMNSEIECNTNITANSIDYSGETNKSEINEVVSSVKDFIAEQQNVSTDNHDNDATNTEFDRLTGKSNIKQKKNLRSLPVSKNEAMNSEKSDQQLSSDKYMENFGFFSFRQPRNANLLASKKISETYNMIENDDADFRPKERQKRHSHNENRKILANGAHSSKTNQEVDNSIDSRISVASSSSSLNITETNTINEHNSEANDGEVDLITAQRILESEEIRKLERDLYFGFKEAAEANAGKTSGFNYLRAEETRIENVNQNAVDPADTNTDTNHVESPKPTSPDRDESEERAESPEIPESPEGVLIDKPLMYPEEEVNIYEDKYDIIKRRREASANAKQLLKVDEPKKSTNGIKKKKPDKKSKRNLKKPVYQVSQVRTKGALKGFDGIKISIATQDLNMPQSVSPPDQLSSKNKKQKESTGKDRPLSASRNESDVETSGAVVAQSDIYEFQDDERPVAKGYRLSRAMSTPCDKSRSSSSEYEEKKHKSNQYGKEKTVPYSEGNDSKKLDIPKESAKKRYKGKGKGKRTRKKDDNFDDETPREESKRIRKDKPKNNKTPDNHKVAEPENERTADSILAKNDVYSNDNNASTIDDDEPFYDSDFEMPSVPGTSGFVPDRNDESSYDSDSSSPPLSSVLKGPYACTCLSEIDSDDSEIERGCAHRSCRYSHLNAAKNAVMGKIFKNNAVRCDKIDEKPESPQPKPDLDQLFDSLLVPTNNVASTSTIVPIAGPSSANLFYYTKTHMKSQSQINTYLQEKKLSNFDGDSNSFNTTKDSEWVSVSTSLFEKEKSKIDDASNLNNFNENNEESTDNGRYVMVSEKQVQTEDPEQLVRPETAQDLTDEVEPESSDFIVLKRKNNAHKSRGTQTKRFSMSDVETSSHGGESNTSKISKNYRKANKKHKTHHKRNKTFEDEEKHKTSGLKSTAIKSQGSKIKQANKPAKTELDRRGRRSRPKSPTSRKFDEGTSQDNCAGAIGSPRQRASQKGVAEGRARRKCTVGKQNVLAEHWSSSESDAGTGPSRLKGKKSTVVKKSARGKKDQVSKRSHGEPEERPRAPVLKLRARTASSLNNRARLRGLEERHGWIVGQSGKKLVSMLAYSKMLQQLRRKRLRMHRQRRRRRRRRERDRDREEDEDEGERRDHDDDDNDDE